MNFHGRMDIRVLRMHNKGQKLDVLVENTDESSLLDVVNDYVEKAEFWAHELLKFPSFSFKIEKDDVYLEFDKDLMEMYGCISSKYRDIWVGELDEPSFIWKTTAHLINMSKKKLVSPKPRMKLPVSPKPRMKLLVSTNPKMKLHVRRNPNSQTPQIISSGSYISSLHDI